MMVHYVKESCTQYRETAQLDSIQTLEEEEFLSVTTYSSGFTRSNCTMERDVMCTLHGATEPKCRLSVRMSAAFVLMGCLIIKAVYMYAVNLLARGKLKQNCLKFGDVIIASAANPELRVEGYATTLRTTRPQANKEQGVYGKCNR